MAQCERIGDATLYCGDALELLPRVSADVLVTDPVWPNVPAETIPGWEDPQGLFDAAMARLPSLKRLVVVLRNDSDPRFLASVPRQYPYFQGGWMEYAVPHYIGRKLGGSEIAYTFGEPVPSRPGRRVIPGRAPKAQPSERPPNGHPCSRALPHMKWIIDYYSDPGETVLDPFMGSGTTGVACALYGRPFIGIEIEPRYFDIACSRIKDAYAQGDLVNAAERVALRQRRCRANARPPRRVLGDAVPGAGPMSQSTGTVHFPGHHLHDRRVEVVSETYDLVWKRRWLGEVVDVRADDGETYALPVKAVRITNKEAA